MLGTNLLQVWCLESKFDLYRLAAHLNCYLGAETVPIKQFFFIQTGVLLHILQNEFKWIILKILRFDFLAMEFQLYFENNH